MSTLNHFSKLSQKFQQERKQSTKVNIHPTWDARKEPAGNEIIASKE
jgi:hypothetical protein